jgi:hypothetical protein
LRLFLQGFPQRLLWWRSCLVRLRRFIGHALLRRLCTRRIFWFWRPF